jgi:hypothetical protein
MSLLPVDLLDLLQHHIRQVDGRGVVLRLDDPFQVPQVDLLLRQLGVAVIDDLGHEVVEPHERPDVLAEHVQLSERGLVALPVVSTDGQSHRMKDAQHRKENPQPNH